MWMATNTKLSRHISQPLKDLWGGVSLQSCTYESLYIVVISFISVVLPILNYYKCLLTARPGRPCNPLCPLKPGMPLGPLSPGTPFSPRGPCGPWRRKTHQKKKRNIKWNVLKYFRDIVSQRENES